MWCVNICVCVYIWPHSLNEEKNELSLWKLPRWLELDGIFWPHRGPLILRVVVELLKEVMSFKKKWYSNIKCHVVYRGGWTCTFCGCLHSKHLRKSMINIILSLVHRASKNITYFIEYNIAFEITWEKPLKTRLSIAKYFLTGLVTVCNAVITRFRL